MRPLRTATLCVAIAVGLATLATGVRADEVAVPVDLQIELLGRVARYERGFAGRTGEPARVLVVVRSGNAESVRIAAQLAAALARARTLGGRTLIVTRHDYRSEATLAAALARDPVDILYLAAGMGDAVPAIARAVGTRNVITVSAVGGDVDRGVVLGFELAASHPQIAVNIVHARIQQLDFSAQLLRLARVVR
jgi:hypothetical protein